MAVSVGLLATQAGKQSSSSASGVKAKSVRFGDEVAPADSPVHSSAPAPGDSHSLLTKPSAEDFENAQVGFLQCAGAREPGWNVMLLQLRPGFAIGAERHPQQVLRLGLGRMIHAPHMNADSGHSSTAEGPMVHNGDPPVWQLAGWPSITLKPRL